MVVYNIQVAHHKVHREGIRFWFWIKDDQIKLSRLAFRIPKDDEEDIAQVPT